MAVVVHLFYLVIYLLLFVAVVLVSRKTRSTLRRLKCQLLKDQEHDDNQLQGPATDTVNPEQQPSHPPECGIRQDEVVYEEVMVYEEMDQENSDGISMTENTAYGNC